MLILIRICWNCKSSLEKIKQNFFWQHWPIWRMPAIALDYANFLFGQHWQVNVDHMWRQDQNDLVTLTFRKSTLALAMEFKRHQRAIKVYAVYGKVSRKTLNGVTTMNLAAHKMRKLKVSMAKKYLTTSLAMFENAVVLMDDIVRG